MIHFSSLSQLSKINDRIIAWRIINSNNTIVDTFDSSLWLHDKENAMLIRNIGSRIDMGGILVRCEIIKNDEIQSTSNVIGVGFARLDPH